MNATAYGEGSPSEAATVSPSHPAKRSLAARLPVLKTLATSRIESKAAFRGLLESNGLLTFGGIWAFEGGEMVTRHRDRSVVRLKVTGTEGERTFFLKRLGRPGFKQVFECLRALERPLSKCMREWKYARILAENGVETAPLAAVGEVRLGPFPLESFLVAGEINGAVSLDEFLEGRGHDRLAPSEKRLLISRLAETVAGMHGAHIFHQDLYAKHIFVRRRGGDFAINIIDLQRMRVGRRQSLAVKDLAALNVTLALSAASTADRMRFLAEYARLRFAGTDKGTLKRLAAAVVKRSLRISGRSKFRRNSWRSQDRQ